MAGRQYNYLDSRGENTYLLCLISSECHVRDRCDPLCAGVVATGNTVAGAMGSKGLKAWPWHRIAARILPKAVQCPLGRLGERGSPGSSTIPYSIEVRAWMCLLCYAIEVAQAVGLRFNVFNSWSIGSAVASWDRTDGDRTPICHRWAAWLLA